jgi:GTP pyrophosphokinase
VPGSASRTSGDNRIAGRTIAERELQRVGFKQEQFSALVQALEARDADHLYQLLGEGEITVTQLLQAASRLPGSQLVETRRHIAGRPSRPGQHPPWRLPVEIEGVGDLPATLARCCAPLRPQPLPAT